MLAAPPLAREHVTKLVRRLEADPVAARVKPPGARAAVKVVLDGGALVNWLIDTVTQTPQYRDVPTWIAELADGRPRWAHRVARGQQRGVAQRRDRPPPLRRSMPRS